MSQKSLSESSTTHSVSQVCVLMEGSYHYGLGALLNSLIHWNFSGIVWVGYRGEIPAWVEELHPCAGTTGSWRYSPKVEIIFVPIAPGLPLVNLKPTFMLDLFERFGLSHLFFFDADIVLMRDWSFFPDWLSYGVALFEDMLSPRSPQHIKRVKWRELLEASGLTEVREQGVYVNAGFMGLKVEHKAILENWKLLQEIAAKEVGGLGRSIVMEKSRDDYRRATPLHLTYFDQDCLNGALSLTDVPLTLLDRVAMGMFCTGEVLCHGIDIPKPWQYTRWDRLRGKKGWHPYYWLYWGHTSGPITLYPGLRTKLKKFVKGLKFGNSLKTSISGPLESSFGASQE